MATQSKYRKKYEMGTQAMYNPSQTNPSSQALAGYSQGSVTGSTPGFDATKAIPGMGMGLDRTIGGGINAIGGYMHGENQRQKMMADARNQADIQGSMNSQGRNFGAVQAQQTDTVLRNQDLNSINSSYQRMYEQGTEAIQPDYEEESVNSGEALIEVEQDELIFRRFGSTYRMVADFNGGDTHEQGGEPFVAKEGDIIFPGYMRDMILPMIDSNGYVKYKFKEEFEELREQLPEDTPQGTAEGQAVSPEIEGTGMEMLHEQPQQQEIPVPQFRQGSGRYAIARSKQFEMGTQAINPAQQEALPSMQTETPAPQVPAAIEPQRGFRSQVMNPAPQMQPVGRMAIEGEQFADMAGKGPLDPNRQAPLMEQPLSPQVQQMQQRQALNAVNQQTMPAVDRLLNQQQEQLQPKEKQPRDRSGFQKTIGGLLEGGSSPVQTTQNAGQFMFALGQDIDQQTQQSMANYQSKYRRGTKAVLPQYEGGGYSFKGAGVAGRSGSGGGGYGYSGPLADPSTYNPEAILNEKIKYRWVDPKTGETKEIKKGDPEYDENEKYIDEMRNRELFEKPFGPNGKPHLYKDKSGKVLHTPNNYNYGDWGAMIDVSTFRKEQEEAPTPPPPAPAPAPPPPPQEPPMRTEVKKEVHDNRKRGFNNQQSATIAQTIGGGGMAMPVMGRQGISWQMPQGGGGGINVGHKNEQRQDDYNQNMENYGVKGDVSYNPEKKYRKGTKNKINAEGNVDRSANRDSIVDSDHSNISHSYSKSGDYNMTAKSNIDSHDRNISGPITIGGSGKDARKINKQFYKSTGKMNRQDNRHERKMAEHKDKFFADTPQQQQQTPVGREPVMNDIRAKQPVQQPPQQLPSQQAFRGTDQAPVMRPASTAAMYQPGMGETESKAPDFTPISINPNFSLSSSQQSPVQPVNSYRQEIQRITAPQTQAEMPEVQYKQQAQNAVSNAYTQPQAQSQEQGPVSHFPEELQRKLDNFRQSGINPDPYFAITPEMHKHLGPKAHFFNEREKYIKEIATPEERNKYFRASPGVSPINLPEKAPSGIKIPEPQAYSKGVYRKKYESGTNAVDRTANTGSIVGSEGANIKYENAESGSVGVTAKSNIDSNDRNMDGPVSVISDPNLNKPTRLRGGRPMGADALGPMTYQKMTPEQMNLEQKNYRDLSDPLRLQNLNAVQQSMQAGTMAGGGGGLAGIMNAQAQGMDRSMGIEANEAQRLGAVQDSNVDVRNQEAQINAQMRQQANQVNLDNATGLQSANKGIEAQNIAFKQAAQQRADAYAMNQASMDQRNKELGFQQDADNKALGLQLIQQRAQEKQLRADRKERLMGGQPQQQTTAPNPTQYAVPPGTVPLNPNQSNQSPVMAIPPPNTNPYSPPTEQQVQQQTADPVGNLFLNRKYPHGTKYLKYAKGSKFVLSNC